MLSQFPDSIRPVARLFILQHFCTLTVLLLPVYIPAMVDHGLSAVTISALMCCLYVTPFIFEIPSGVWADQYSRRKVLMAAELVCSTGFIIVGLFPNVVGFAICLIFWAMRTTMYSGTHDAYMYDELAHYGHADYFSKVRSLTKIGQWISVTISAAGIWVYHEYGLGLVAALSVAARMSGFTILWFMPEVGKAKMVNKVSFFQQIGECLNVIRTYKNILWIGLYSCLFNYIMVVYEYRTLLATEWKLTTDLSTIFAAGCGIALCLGSVLSAYWPRENWKRLLSLGVLSGIVTFLSSYSGYGWLSAVFFMLSLVLSQWWLMGTVVIQQHVTPSHVRASVGSMVGFASAILNIAQTQIMGLVAGSPPRYLPSLQLFSIAGFVVAAVLWVGYWLKYHKSAQIK